MNPFNQPRFRNEAQLGKSYQDVRYLIENMQIIKKLVDNLENYRSGNIRLKTEGSELFWGYSESEDWYLLGTLATNADIQDLQQAINSINLTLDNQNGILSTVQNALNINNGIIQNLDERLDILEGSFLSLEGRVLALENEEDT